MRRTPAVLCGLLLAAASLPACGIPDGIGAVQSSSAHSYSVDTECQAGVPFVHAYYRVIEQFDPQLETARQELNAAHNDPRARAALQRIAAILDAYDSALGPLAAPGSDAPLLSSVVRAGGEMALQARTLAAEPAGERDVTSFDAAVLSRAEFSRALSLRVAFLRSECL